MPVYCYRNDREELVEISMSVSEMERREAPDGTLMHDGEWLKRDYQTELGTRPPSAGAWPVISESAGCHPSQIREMQEHARKKAGVHLNFTPDGRAIFESPGQRKKYLRSVGIRDNNGGYGDP